MQIIDLLTLVKDFGDLKCYLAGVLLKEEADILELQGKEAESSDTRTKSLSLLTQAAIEKGAPVDSDHASAVDGVAAKLNHASLPVHIHKKLFYYYELMRQYGEAKSAVFDIVEKEPSFVEEGLQFYERLGKKADDDLRAGNLSRKEIAESVNALRGKIS